MSAATVDAWLAEGAASSIAATPRTHNFDIGGKAAGMMISA